MRNAALPASGPATSLPPGLGDARVNAETCQTSPQLPLVDGKPQNELLGQTIALMLNAGGVFDEGGLTPDGVSSEEGLLLSDIWGLWHLVVCNTMVTQAALPGNDGLLGTQDDQLDPGPDGILGTQDDPKLAVTIPTSVVNTIAAGSHLELLGKFTFGLRRVPAGSVGRLLILANLALAGETDLGGASLADINAAVDAVNRAFDGCRFLISCSCPSCADLQIIFNPNPAFARTTADCNSLYEFTVILKEAKGVGIIFSRLDIDSFQNFPLSQVGFPSRINANAEFRGGISYCRGSGTSVWTVFGRDDNGNQRVWSGTIQLK